MSTDTSKNLSDLLGQIQQNLQCSICLELLNNPVATKCNHRFCSFCITKFLNTKRTVPCPLCKTSVTKRSLQDMTELTTVIQGVKTLIDAFEKDSGQTYTPCKNVGKVLTPESKTSCHGSSSKRKVKGKASASKRSTGAGTSSENYSISLGTETPSTSTSSLETGTGSSSLSGNSKRLGVRKETAGVSDSDSIEVLEGMQQTDYDHRTSNKTSSRSRRELLKFLEEGTISHPDVPEASKTSAGLSVCDRQNVGNNNNNNGRGLKERSRIHEDVSTSSRGQFESQDENRSLNIDSNPNICGNEKDRSRRPCRNRNKPDEIKLETTVPSEHEHNKTHNDVKKNNGKVVGVGYNDIAGGTSESKERISSVDGVQKTGIGKRASRSSSRKGRGKYRDDELPNEQASCLVKDGEEFSDSLAQMENSTTLKQTRRNNNYLMPLNGDECKTTPEPRRLTRNRSFDKGKKHSFNKDELEMGSTVITGKSADTDTTLLSPAASVCSTSSTQQLQRPIQPVSRTYSKKMKNAFSDSTAQWALIQSDLKKGCLEQEVEYNHVEKEADVNSLQSVAVKDLPVKALHFQSGQENEAVDECDIVIVRSKSAAFNKSSEKKMVFKDRIVNVTNNRLDSISDIVDIKPKHENKMKSKNSAEIRSDSSTKPGSNKKTLSKNKTEYLSRKDSELDTSHNVLDLCNEDTQIHTCDGCENNNKTEGSKPIPRKKTIFKSKNLSPQTGGSRLSHSSTSSSDPYDFQGGGTPVRNRARVDKRERVRRNVKGKKASFKVPLDIHSISLSSKPVDETPCRSEKGQDKEYLKVLHPPSASTATASASTTTTLASTTTTLASTTTKRVHFAEAYDVIHTPTKVETSSKNDVQASKDGDVLSKEHVQISNGKIQSLHSEIEIEKSSTNNEKLSKGSEQLSKGEIQSLKEKDQRSEKTDLSKSNNNDDIVSSLVCGDGVNSRGFQGNQPSAISSDQCDNDDEANKRLEKQSADGKTSRSNDIGLDGDVIVVEKEISNGKSIENRVTVNEQDAVKDGTKVYESCSVSVVESAPVPQKRGRRQRVRRSDSFEGKVRDREIERMKSKINDAEDYEFMFSTQEARQRLVYEQDNRIDKMPNKEIESAFGFEESEEREDEETKKGHTSCEKKLKARVNEVSMTAVDIDVPGEDLNCNTVVETRDKVDGDSGRLRKEKNKRHSKGKEDGVNGILSSDTDLDTNKETVMDNVDNALDLEDKSVGLDGLNKEGTPQSVGKMTPIPKSQPLSGRGSSIINESPVTQRTSGLGRTAARRFPRPDVSLMTPFTPVRQSGIGSIVESPQIIFETPLQTPCEKSSTPKNSKANTGEQVKDVENCFVSESPLGDGCVKERRRNLMGEMVECKETREKDLKRLGNEGKTEEAGLNARRKDRQRLTFSDTPIGGDRNKDAKDIDNEENSNCADSVTTSAVIAEDTCVDEMNDVKNNMPVDENNSLIIPETEYVNTMQDDDGDGGDDDDDGDSENEDDNDDSSNQRSDEVNQKKSGERNQSNSKVLSDTKQNIRAQVQDEIDKDVVHLEGDTLPANMFSYPVTDGTQSPALFTGDKLRLSTRSQRNVNMSTDDVDGNENAYYNSNSSGNTVISATHRSQTSKHARSEDEYRESQIKISDSLAKYTDSQDKDKESQHVCISSTYTVGHGYPKDEDINAEQGNNDVRIVNSIHPPDIDKADDQVESRSSTNQTTSQDVVIVPDLDLESDSTSPFISQSILSHPQTGTSSLKPPKANTVTTKSEAQKQLPSDTKAMAIKGSSETGMSSSNIIMCSVENDASLAKVKSCHLVSNCKTVSDGCLSPNSSGLHSNIKATSHPLSSPPALAKKTQSPGPGTEPRKRRSVAFPVQNDETTICVKRKKSRTDFDSGNESLGIQGSAPGRLNQNQNRFSDSDDEKDSVLIVRRRSKRKCLSLDSLPLQPVVFGNSGKANNLENIKKDWDIMTNMNTADQIKTSIDDITRSNSSSIVKDSSHTKTTQDNELNKPVQSGSSYNTSSSVSPCIVEPSCENNPTALTRKTRRGFARRDNLFHKKPLVSHPNSVLSPKVKAAIYKEFTSTAENESKSPKGDDDHLDDGQQTISKSPKGDDDHLDDGQQTISKSPEGDDDHLDDGQQTISKSPKGDDDHLDDGQQTISKSPKGDDDHLDDGQQTISKSPEGDDDHLDDGQQTISKSPKGDDDHLDDGQQTISKSPEGDDDHLDDGQQTISKSPKGDDDHPDDGQQTISKSPKGDDDHLDDGQQTISKSPEGDDDHLDDGQQTISKSPKGDDDHLDDRQQTISKSPKGDDDHPDDGQQTISKSPKGDDDHPDDGQQTISKSPKGDDDHLDDGQQTISKSPEGDDDHLDDGQQTISKSPKGDDDHLDDGQQTISDKTSRMETDEPLQLQDGKTGNEDDDFIKETITSLTTNNEIHVEQEDVTSKISNTIDDSPKDSFMDNELHLQEEETLEDLLPKSKRLDELPDDPMDSSLPCSNDSVVTNGHEVPCHVVEQNLEIEVAKAKLCHNSKNKIKGSSKLKDEDKKRLEEELFGPEKQQGEEEDEDTTESELEDIHSDIRLTLSGKSASSQSSGGSSIGSQQHNQPLKEESFIIKLDDDEDDDSDAFVKDNEDFIAPSKKRKRQRITSDDEDDTENERNNSENNYTSSSAFSSQSEVMTTQQRDALEIDVAQLQQEIALCEAAIQDPDGAPVPPGRDNNNDDDDNNNDDMVLVEKSPRCQNDQNGDDDNSDSKTNKEEEMGSDDDLFILDPSPSPKKPALRTPTVSSRPVLSTSSGMASKTRDFVQQSSSWRSLRKQRPLLEFSRNSPTAVDANPSHYVPQPKGGKLESTDNKRSIENHNLSIEVVGESDGLDDDDDENEEMVTTSTGNSANDNGSNNNYLEGGAACPSPVIFSQGENERRKIALQRLSQDATIVTSSLQEIKMTHVVASGLNGPEMQMVQKLTMCLPNVKLTAKIRPDVTHVIMKSVPGPELVCDRTLKYFQGLARRLWIVSFQWVVRSLKAGQLLSEEEFEIQGDTSVGDTTFGPKKARLSTHQLFEDYCFACVGNSPELPRENMEELLTLCGASLAQDFIALPSSARGNKIIISCTETNLTDAEMAMLNGVYGSTGIVSVKRDWILDSISSYQVFPLDVYVLNQT